ncbi:MULTISPECIES: hypothetical protein [unclassified Vibrio]|uniref:hypothetical protein n=1 Tax=unclassified Vibrio TaxID=2614977 RepID=UPI001A8C6C87|nr:MULTISPECIES: hypothetical protein [unclassified Vibrio]MBO0243239.1 hypothetical protein [Vibrio sp. Vb0592]MDW1732419.1 hypothetical protein [Vibrio sp. Vb2235]MDW1784690.1 hypothetical protein [Vibrio sp. Vb2227]MDW1814322.1 hypothetical protein [Vibrio sp. Vb2232]MDW1864518.1 hypothetical protein [Vibrio sp. Vb1127]
MPVLVAITGYAIVHILSAMRDSRNKKREIRIRFLSDCYQRLALILSASENWSFENLQLVLVDIQLVGTDSQIKKAEQIAQRVPVAFNNPNDSSIDLEPLLIDIRNDLRYELSMEKTNSRFIWLKTYKASKQVEN